MNPWLAVACMTVMFTGGWGLGHKPSVAKPVGLVAIVKCGSVIALTIVASDGSLHDAPELTSSELDATMPRIIYKMPCRESI